MQKTVGIKAIAIIVILYGACRFLLSITSLLASITNLGKMETSLPDLLFNILANLLLPLVFIAVGILVFQRKKSGRILLLILLSVELTLRLFLIINYWYQSRKILPLIASSSDTTVRFIHPWHMYILSLLELVFIAYLSLSKIKAQFSPPKPNT